MSERLQVRGHQFQHEIVRARQHVAGLYVRMVDDINRDAAWVYRMPKEAARPIAGRIASWNGVQVR